MAAVVRPEAAQGRLTGSAPDTIFALASGAPPAAIAIVRVSGPDAWAVAAALAGPLPAPRYAALRRIADPVDGALIDHAILLLFEANASPTGEKVAEFQLHGGRAVVAALEAALGRQPGLRRAEPGEFTWRAFRNGRLDLAEVDGLADLLQSETEAQRRAALAMADGGLSARIADWRDRLLLLSAGIEAQLDFADEGDVAEVDPAPILDPLIEEMRSTLLSPSAERLRDGIHIVIAGPPNAGKSSLLNALIGREAAIVSDIAGTTRDMIEVDAVIAGHAVRLTDTAGLRGDSLDPIEQIGIARAEGRIAAADLLLWLGDDAPLGILAPVVHLHPRADQPGRQTADHGRIAVSTVTPGGLNLLIDALLPLLGDLVPISVIALNNRQSSLLSATVAALSTSRSDDLVLLADHVRAALVLLDRLTGRDTTDEMLGALFGRFCIGK